MATRKGRTYLKKLYGRWPTSDVTDGKKRFTNLGSSVVAGLVIRCLAGKQGVSKAAEWECAASRRDPLGGLRSALQGSGGGVGWVRVVPNSKIATTKAATSLGSSKDAYVLHLRGQVRKGHMELKMKRGQRNKGRNRYTLSNRNIGTYRSVGSSCGCTKG